MITEKQKEAVMELCRYVENFCKENDLSAFMSVAASEDHPDGLEQVAGSIVTGKGDHVVGSISGTVKTDKRVCMLLSMSPSVRDVIRGPQVNTQSGRRAPMTIGMWRGRNRKGARHEQDKETAGDLSSCLYV